MAEEIRDIDMPFRVVTVVDNNFHSGHMTQEGALARAEQANKDAVILGIKTRYTVVNKA